jgi:hypothetical protein
MPSATLAKRVTRVYSAEQWAEARRLYEGGLSLEGVAEKLRLPYSSVHYHAWVEGWPVRCRGGRKDPRLQAAQAKRIRRKLEKEEKRLEQDLALVKTEDIELLARRSLAADSARAKVAVSRRVTEILSRLDSSVPVRSAAQALGSLAPIFRLLYRWSNEAEIQSMKLARKGGDDIPTAAVNLRLIATTPEELAAMAKAKVDLDDHSGPFATECNGQGLGPSGTAPKQPGGAAHGCPISEKEAPTGPVKEPAPPSRTVNKAAPLLAPEQPVQSDAPPPHGAQEQEARLAAIAKARVEHRGANWEKYR